MDTLGNWRLEVEYDGRGYCGWQKQPEEISVQGTIEKALSVILREPISVTGAGRTDAGVHARGQIANFKSGGKIDIRLLRHQVNAVLPSDIAVRQIEAVEPDFDARRSAKKRFYTYMILNRPFPSPFWRRYSWWISKPFDVKKARVAAKSLVGIHDFSGFTVTKLGSKTREVFSVDISLDRQEEMIRLEFCANAFLHHMVRLIVGTLAEIGIGKLEPSVIREVLDSRDIKLAGPRAPAKGLWLEKVEY